MTSFRWPELQPVWTYKHDYPDSPVTPPVGVRILKATYKYYMYLKCIEYVYIAHTHIYIYTHTHVFWLESGTLQPEQQHYGNMYWRFRAFKLGLCPFLLHKEAEALEPTELHHLLQRVGCCHDYRGTFSRCRSSESGKFGNWNQYRTRTVYIVLLDLTDTILFNVRLNVCLLEHCFPVCT